MFIIHVKYGLIPLSTISGVIQKYGESAIRNQDVK